MLGGWASDFQYSLGFNLGAGNRITGVRWGSLAFAEGLGAGWDLVAVGDRTASPAALRAAVTAAKTSAEPIRLVVKRGDEFRTLDFDYHGGLRYPRLVRIPGTRDRLADIFAPRRR
jgi:predicted metalloprotease with PDZ domain